MRWTVANHPTNGGRPRGARNKLARRFVEDLQADWEAHGPGAIRIMRIEDPVAYVKTVAAILPREFEFTHTTVTEFSDDALERAYDWLIEPEEPMKLIEAPINGKTKALG
jgi:hypothetical protein